MEIQPATSDMPINCSAPTKEIICSAIEHVKNDKYDGIYSIPAVALNGVVETSVDILCPLFGKIRNE
ncbi:hypothetical protein DPMN_177178 [Dreissena polymorpha]|uniref:Uncharacterized protein n=1 Tax=Dreissena polymorpha TaxID=45954 RepID=A0A9D4ECT8_DREPO|nr:hypothetical protein DPMN_177178 [Dreissena polymorpha]